MKKIRLPYFLESADKVDLSNLSDEEFRVLGNLLNETDPIDQQVLLHTAIALKCGIITKAQKAVIDNFGSADFYSAYLQEKDRRNTADYFASFSL